MPFLICYNAPALSVAIRVCPFLKAAVIPAISALFMIFMLVSPYCNEKTKKKLRRQ
jgi:hypothetical protein